MSGFTDKDREMLVRLDERTQTLQDSLKLHLSRHWKLELMVLGGFVSLVVAGCVAYWF